MKCCDITAGLLRTPAQLEREIKTPAGAGSTNLSRQEHGNPFRCHFKWLSGTERFYSKRLDAQTKARIIMRFRADVKDSDTVLIRDRRFNIRFIDNVEQRDKWLVIDLDGGVAL